MRSLVILFALFALFGCAPTLPLDATLTLTVAAQPGGGYPAGTAATLQGSDKRADSAVISYAIKDDPPVMLPSRHDPQIILTEKLAIGFREQGLVFEHQAPARLILEIEGLLATVTKPKLLYNTEAISVVALTVTKHGNSLTKRYKKESSRASATRPDLEDVEALLNEQLSRIVEQILADGEIRAIIVGGS
ncbi:YajG family lipoprotein [Desulfofustis limnaeus]|uniref:Lipoprotein n=1 Tax=Desulfofustis limnaeus TaxID=2740163 RepID=A0ABM7WAH9_9BACT|nr:YajG family lipoprotein [Desulfofustis limnaeus]BDD87952.1 hypothetical protein DPPLL_23170 [Desulfofustis limnaeus]